MQEDGNIDDYDNMYIEASDDVDGFVESFESFVATDMTGSDVYIVRNRRYRHYMDSGKENRCSSRTRQPIRQTAPTMPATLIIKVPPPSPGSIHLCIQLALHDPDQIRNEVADNRQVQSAEEL